MIQTIDSIKVVADNWTRLNEYRPPHDSRKIYEYYTTQNGFNLRLSHSEEKCGIFRIEFSNDLSQFNGTWDFKVKALGEEMVKQLFTEFKEEKDLEQHLGGHVKVYKHKDNEFTELRVYERFLAVDNIQSGLMEGILNLIHEVGKKNFESGNLTILRPSSRWKKGEWA